MIPYATTTRTRRNVAALRAAGWRLLLSPDIHTLHDGFQYGLDNGAWGAHQSGRPWDADKFRELVLRYGADADWVIVPDVVGDSLASLARTKEWLPFCLDHCPRVLVALQDGMAPRMVHPLPITGRIGFFVGGTTHWKLHTLPMWATLARTIGVWLHVGRVNTARRIRLCQSVGAHSFDGTSVTRYAVTLDELDEARRQEGLWRLPAPSSFAPVASTRSSAPSSPPSTTARSVPSPSTTDNGTP